MAIQFWVIKLHSLNTAPTQDMHCLYKKALMSICVPTVVVEMQYV